MTECRRVDGADAFPKELGETLVVVGNFDGVHRGHRVVLSAALVEASRRSLTPVVLTFHPHPAKVLGRGELVALTCLEHKVELLTQISPALWVVVQPFSAGFAACSAQEFVERLLVSELRAKTVIVGENFRFGQGRQGDLALLQLMGQQFGFDTLSARLEGDSLGPFSSTRVRMALMRGELAAVQSLLQRPHSITGRVGPGDGRGRTIGIPTANLCGIEEAWPPSGVYACWVDSRRPTQQEFSPLARGVLNIGVRPTVTAGFSIEVHLLDFEGDLYGQDLRVHFCARLRDEQRFASLPALVQQIQRDIAMARELLSSVECAENNKSSGGDSS